MNCKQIICLVVALIMLATAFTPLAARNRPYWDPLAQDPTAHPWQDETQVTSELYYARIVVVVGPIVIAFENPFASANKSKAPGKPRTADVSKFDRAGVENQKIATALTQKGF